MLIEAQRTLSCYQQNEELPAISSNTKDSEVLVATQESKCQQKHEGHSVVNIRSRTKNTQMLVATEALQDVSSHTGLEMLKDSEMLVATQESQCQQRQTLSCKQQNEELPAVSSNTKDSEVLVVAQESKCQQRHKGLSFVNSRTRTPSGQLYSKCLHSSPNYATNTTFCIICNRFFSISSIRRCLI